MPKRQPRTSPKRRRGREADAASVSAMDLLGWASRWHDFAEVVGAIFTALAVVVALAFGYIESMSRRRADERAHKAERERDAAQQERRSAEQESALARRAEQARHIIAWLEDSPEGGSNFPADLVIANYSDRPVFDIVVKVTNPALEGWASVQPNVSVLGPGEVRRRTYGEMATPLWMHETAIAFVDAQGVRWIRERRHAPVEVAHDPEWWREDTTQDPEASGLPGC